MKVNWMLYIIIIECQVVVKVITHFHQKTTLKLRIFSVVMAQNWNVLILKLITMLPSSKMLSTNELATSILIEF